MNPNQKFIDYSVTYKPVMHSRNYNAACNIASYLRAGRPVCRPCSDDLEMNNAVCVSARMEVWDFENKKLQRLGYDYFMDVPTWFRLNGSQRKQTIVLIKRTITENMAKMLVGVDDA